MMIEVENLTKHYGDFVAIEDISFQIDRGEVVGFLGPNGAGKTTTMRVLTGYLPPTSGHARIGGYEVVEQSLQARRHIGYLPETVPLYLDMTVEAYLDFLGKIRGMDAGYRARRINEVIDRMNLHQYRHTHISKLSKGFRQRTGLAQAILHEPDVLILDEPTIGIDPVQVVETRQLIKELGEDHTLIISTHILPEVSAVCQRVIIIHEGRIVAVDTPENLSRRLRRTEQVEIEVRGPQAEVANLLRNFPGVQDVRWVSSAESTTFTLTSRQGADLREQLARTITQRGWGLLRLQSLDLSLEEIFLRLTVGEQQE